MNTSAVALAYRESAALGASGTGIVVLLYDRLAQDIQSAILAMAANDVEGRTMHVSHALLVLQQLQGRLDFATGGSAAEQLNAFYSHIRGKLLEAQIKQSPKLLLEQAEAVVKIRECWAHVDRDIRARQIAETPVADTISSPQEAEPATMSWGA